MFLRHASKGINVLIVYVDDTIIMSDNLEEISKVKKYLLKVFEMNDLGLLKYFLGTEIVVP